jgi:hypothetical protein
MTRAVLILAGVSDTTAPASTRLSTGTLMIDADDPRRQEAAMAWGGLLLREFAADREREKCVRLQVKQWEMDSGLTMLPAVAELPPKKVVGSERRPRLAAGSPDPDRVIVPRPNRRVKPAHDPRSPFPETFNVEQAAAAIGLSPPFIYSEAAAGRIHHSRYNGRIQFTQQDIDEYIRDHRVA